MPDRIRFVLDSQRNDPDGWALLEGHRTLCQLPGHQEQVQAVKVGWRGYPVFEFTCPACRIRWRTKE